MKGLMVNDWMSQQAEFEREVGDYFRSGKLIDRNTTVKGIDEAVGAFFGLFAGHNIGKMVVALA